MEKHKFQENPLWPRRCIICERPFDDEEHSHHVDAVAERKPDVKHSLGPWRRGPENYADIYAANGDLVALAIKRLPETVANGVLIAAAPNLLEALRAVVNDKGLLELIDGIGEKPDFWDQCLAAIASAEGAK